MKGHFYKPSCKCDGNRCKCGATWSYIVDVGINPATGKRMQKKKGGFATKAAAEAHLAELLVSVNNNTFKNESNLSFEAFSVQWLEMYRQTGFSKPSTSNLREKQLSVLNQYIAKLALKDMNRKVLQDTINSMREHYSDNSIKGIVNVLKMILKKAFELGLTKNNHSEFLFIPKLPEQVDSEKVVKYLEKDELKRLLDHCKVSTHHQEYLIFLVLAYTGMRVGELCGLKWSDIDFLNQTITISRTLVTTGRLKDYTLQTPKTKESNRTIHIDEMLAAELEKHRSRYNVFRMSVMNNFHNEDFVFINFTNAIGYPQNQNLINKRMKILLRQVGLPDTLSPHSLRHTNTSLLAEAGVTLETIMKLLGHKNDATTKNVYLHVTKPVLKEASYKLSKLMNSI